MNAIRNDLSRGFVDRILRQCSRGKAVNASNSAFASIAEMHRVLVPGGEVLLLDHIGSSWPPLYGAMAGRAAHEAARR